MVSLDYFSSKLFYFVVIYDEICYTFRSLSIPKEKITNSKEMTLYRDILEMNAAICLFLNKVVNNSPFCQRSLLHMQDCLNFMLSLLNANIYCKVCSLTRISDFIIDVFVVTDFPELLFLLNKLWAEIYRLIGVLIEYRDDDCENIKNQMRDSFSIITNCISQCGKHAFLRSLCESINSNQSDG